MRRVITAVAAFLRRWPLAEIHDTLGSDATMVLPPLFGLRAVTVRLPEFLVRAIELSDENDNITVDEWLHEELVDFAGTVATTMEQVISGFRRAYLFPDQV
ncbi:MAG TPA: hypothetical protein VGO08_03875 [Burkholderiales bacterium]|nr:hypothetical protein [Burkholderiales bacterium]